MKDAATSAGAPQPAGRAVDLTGASAALAAPERPRRPWYRRPLVVRLVAGLLILAVWQLVVDAWAQDYVARPTGVIRVIPSVLTEKLFLSDIVTTLAAVIEGLAIAVVLGTAIGLVVGRLPDVQRILGMYVNGVYALPIIAVVPLLTVWFGYTPKARLVVIVLEAMLPVIYNVAEGARTVPRTYLDVTRIHRAPWWRVWFGVALPASTPYVLAGIDLAIGRALIGAVVAEFIAAINGLGYYILFNVNSFHENRAIVALIVLALTAILLRAVINLVVRRGFSWYWLA
jgi:ABC-type nitrate/sulfonate/bicarbonate transport system permease component